MSNPSNEPKAGGRGRGRGASLLEALRRTREARVTGQRPQPVDPPTDEMAKAKLTKATESMPIEGKDVTSPLQVAEAIQKRGSAGQDFPVQTNFAPLCE